VRTRVETARNLYRNLLTKYKGKRPLGRPKYKQQGNIKVDRKQIICKEMEWCNLTEYMDELCTR